MFTEKDSSLQRCREDTGKSGGVAFILTVQGQRGEGNAGRGSQRGHLPGAVTSGYPGAARFR